MDTPHTTNSNKNLANLLLGNEISSDASPSNGHGDDSTKVHDWSDTTCPNCGYAYASGNRSWCPQCGYLPNLGTFVDLDDYDREDADAVPTSAADLAWWQLIPLWLWIGVGGVIFLAAMSLSVLLSTSAESALRTRWSLLQILVGLLACLGAHALAFYRANLETDAFSPFDILLKPLDIWSRSIRELPYSSKRFLSAVWGFTAIFLAVTVIGGIPYERFWDWGFKQPVEQDLLAAIIDQAKQNAGKKAGNEDGDLSDALNDLDSDGDGIPDADAILNLLPPNKMECLIIGYMMDDQETEKLDRVILAGLVDNEFRCVGSLRADKIPEDVVEHLLERMPRLEQPKPFLANDYHNAIWLKPKLTCRVLYKKWDQRGRLEEPELVQLLAEMP